MRATALQCGQRWPSPDAKPQRSQVPEPSAPKTNADAPHAGQVEAWMSGTKRVDQSLTIAVSGGGVILNVSSVTATLTFGSMKSKRLRFPWASTMSARRTWNTAPST